MDVCRDLNDAAPLRRIEVAAEPGIIVTTDRAIPIALIINELITNAAKYAYQDVKLGTSGFESLAPMTRSNFRCATKAGGFRRISNSAPHRGSGCASLLRFRSS